MFSETSVTKHNNIGYIIKTNIHKNVAYMKARDNKQLKS